MVYRYTSIPVSTPVSVYNIIRNANKKLSYYVLGTLQVVTNRHVIRVIDDSDLPTAMRSKQV